MPEPRLPENLSNHHLRTLNALFEHPLPHNIEWPDVLSLLRALGEVDERGDGRVAVTIGGSTRVFDPRRKKDVEAEQVVHLRQLLTVAGFGPVQQDDVIRS
jgi:hypothetical protein